MPIKAPVENSSRTLLRTLVEAGASLLPVVPALVRVYETTHPPEFQRALEAWYPAVTAGLNSVEARLSDLEERFHPRLVLSDEAVASAVCIAWDEDAPAHSTLTLLQDSLPDLDRDRVEEAVHELADAGLLVITPTTVEARLRAEWPLHWIFDPLAVSHSPVADAALLARRALNEDLNVFVLGTVLEWPPRRLNPAMELLATLVPNGHQSRPANPGYSVVGLHIDAGTRRRLRQFIGNDGPVEGSAVHQA